MKEGVDVKKEFASYCYGLSKIDDKWYFWWDLFEKKEDRFILYKNKMTNLLKRLNEDESSVLNLDIEKEIWDII